MLHYGKIVIATGIVISAFYGYALGYNLTDYDKNLTWKLNRQVDKSISDTSRSPEFIEKAATKFSTLVDSLAADPRKQAIMKNVFEHTHNQLALATDANTRAFKESFVSAYGSELQGDPFETRLQRCVEKFDMVNTIAKKHNFPTALILATWFMEGSCRTSNPANGDGPFQIVSSHYTPGPLSDAQLEQAIVDFIAFSRKKHDWYHRNNPDRKIVLTYKLRDIESLETQGALYNSVGSSINAWPLRATNEYYNRGNYNLKWKSSVKDGMITAFIRLLKWETEHR